MPSIDGLASGLDTTAMINAIVGAASGPRAALRTQVTGLDDAKKKVEGFQGKLQDLLTALQDLDGADKLAPNTTSVFGSGGFSATSTTSAPTGSHDIKVVSLAASQVSSSQGFADRTSTGAIGEGTLSITVGGVQTDLTIDSANSSLDKVAAALNGVDGVSAWVVDTGQGTDRYQLVVMGSDTGAANGFSFDASGLTGTAPAFTNKRDAVDAVVEVDGITLNSASNKLEGAIPGVTLTLESPSSTTGQLSIARDDDALKTTLKTVVDAYNEVTKYYRAQTAFNSELGIKGGLVGDATARRIMQDLGTVASATRSTGGPFSALSQLGVLTKQNGDLELDEETFDAAVATGFDDALGFLAHADGPLAALRTRLDDVYLADDGLLDARVDTLEESISSTQDRIDKYTESLDKLTSRLRTQFNRMEQIMANLQSTSSQLASLLPSTSLISGSAS